MRVEFELLNARLAEKADNLELAEEQIWRLFAEYIGMSWDGSIKYPGSFNIRDTADEIQQLKMANDIAMESPELKQRIIEKVTEWLGEEEAISPEAEQTAQNQRTYPDGDPIDPRLPQAYAKYDPETGEKCWNCAYYTEESKCSAWNMANVKPKYWCARWEPIVMMDDED